ncbi:MAG: FAD-dependent oxidoreductase [Chitinivibrionales bacterium]|nr:FAD-dependent oxidoreductase [Chitinivibrionales bacterium]
MTAMTDANAFTVHRHESDLCVVGGGMSGLAVAVAAARQGVRVVLMHDRPMLGGNASSECRVHICGADRHNRIPHMRETGILEQLRMLNLYRNPTANFTVWDTLLYETVMAEENITLLLNCSCNGIHMERGRIESVRGWQGTTQSYHDVRARWFADCSGDSVLGYLAGADYRVGREARHEHDESLAPEESSRHTMGHSIRYQVRRYDTPQDFIAPPWAHRYDSCDDLPYGLGGHKHNLVGLGYWWIEFGGELDSIADSERIRDELLRIAYGVWDHIKNRCPKCRHDARFCSLEWMNVVTARRESRRLIGDHILTQNDIAGGGGFGDTVAYGGWTMDDHDSAGFYAARHNRPATHFHQAPSPYGIPWRCLYSRNVENLLMAGRNVSATHIALSSTRVAGTCMSMGQAVGSAVALMKTRGLESPRDVGGHITELQQMLLWDDCYLPGVPAAVAPLCREAHLSASQGDPEPVRDGWARQIGDNPHAWSTGPGGRLVYAFGGASRVEEVAIAFDSAMERETQMSHSNHCIGNQMRSLPDTLAQRFRLDVRRNGEWQTHYATTANIHRHRRIRIGDTVEGVRLTLERFHGNCDASRVYSFLLR